MNTMKNMPYHYGLRVRLYPSFKQKTVIKHNSDAARFVYNKCVAIGRELHELRKVKTYIEPVQDRINFLESQFKSSTGMSNMAPFLNCDDIDSQAKQNAIQNYNAAWNMFRKVHGTSIPTFHKKSYEDTYQTNAHYEKDDHSVLDGTGVRFLDASHIILPKIGRIRVKGCKKHIQAILNRKADTRIGTVTVTKESDGNCYVSFQLASDEPFVCIPEKTGKNIGIDLNLRNFCMDSDGAVVNNPRYKKSLQNKLAKAQRKLSRMEAAAKKAGRPLRKSRNYQKQRVKVAKLHSHIANQRNDFLHCLTKQYIESQDIVVMEDLNVKNMLKNHSLANAISDAGWGKFRQMMSYKGDLYQKTVLFVDPKYTTQTCSACGYILKLEERLTLNDEDWVCPECGTYHVRDKNAASNILMRGMKILNQEQGCIQP